MFGWGFLIGACLLSLVVWAVVRSTYAFKNAEIVKGKIIELRDLGAENLPTVEYKFSGETASFRASTPLDGLNVGEEVDVQLGKSRDVRLYDKNKVDSIPKMLYVVICLLLFMLFKGVTLLS